MPIAICLTQDSTIPFIKCTFIPIYVFQHIRVKSDMVVDIEEKRPFGEAC